MGRQGDSHGTCKSTGTLHHDTLWELLSPPGRPLTVGTFPAKTEHVGLPRTDLLLFREPVLHEQMVKKLSLQCPQRTDSVNDQHMLLTTELVVTTI